MDVPGWLLNIIKGFLENRFMVMAYKDGVSEAKRMPGGGPVRTTLGLIMFIVLINKTADPGEKQAWGQILSAPLKERVSIPFTHAKLIDDASITETIPMDKALIKPQEDF